MPSSTRLAHISAQLVAPSASPPPWPWLEVRPEAQLVRPSGHSDVRPTTDVAVALRNFEEEGFCIVKDALSPSEVTLFRDHLLGVMGDNRHVDGTTGPRLDPATRRFTEPLEPPLEMTSLGNTAEGEYAQANVGCGRAFHSGDFGGVYGDECRLGVEGYIRHDPRIATIGCDQTRGGVDVIDALLGEDFRAVYTDGFIEYPGAANLAWHADQPFIVRDSLVLLTHLSAHGCVLTQGMQTFAGKPVDVSARVTALYMLSDFTPYNGGTWVLPRSHKLPPSEHPHSTWSKKQKGSFHPDAVAAAGPAGSVLIVSAHCPPSW